MSSLPDGWTTERWVYIGRRWSTKLVHSYVRETGPHDADHEMWYSRAPKWAAIGSVYEIETNGSQARIPKTASSVGAVDDEDQLGTWRVLDRSAAAVQESARAAKRLASQNGDFGALTLEQLRDTMESQPRHVQDGTLVAVMRYLTRGR